jgi:hypothetical protein
MRVYAYLVVIAKAPAPEPQQYYDEGEGYYEGEAEGYYEGEGEGYYEGEGEGYYEGEAEAEGYYEGEAEAEGYYEEAASGVTAIALYAYEAAQEGDLAFAAGQVINVLDQSDPSGWWQGELHGATGYFPSTYVQLQ